MISSLNRQEDATLELTITIPWTQVALVYQEVVEQTLAEMELPGFRRGKAPRKLAEEKLDKSKIYEEVLKRVIPKVYNQAVTEQKLRPIVTPKIELKEARENKDWLIRAVTCERPKVELGDYRKIVTELNNSKKNKIWVPGEGDKTAPPGQGPASPPAGGQPQKPTLDELLKALFEAVQVQLPALLIEHEVNRLLSELIDETKKLGLTVDQYLASTGRNAEVIRKEYGEQARRSLTLEFALEEIADREGILVSDDDIDTVVKSAKTDAERETLQKERYYLASVLRRQKTLDFLASLY